MKRLLVVEMEYPQYNFPLRVSELEKFLGEKVEEVGSVNFLLHDDVTKKLSDIIASSGPDLIEIGHDLTSGVLEKILLVAQEENKPVVQGIWSTCPRKSRASRLNGYRYFGSNAVEPDTAVKKELDELFQNTEAENDPISLIFVEQKAHEIIARAYIDDEEKQSMLLHDLALVSNALVEKRLRHLELKDLQSIQRLQK